MLNKIENAYTWEGNAGTKIVSDTETEMKVLVGGSSTVEHEGDISGIEDQVRELKGKEYDVDGICHKITSAECDIETPDHGDEDYTVYVKGTVIISKRKI